MQLLHESYNFACCNSHDPQFPSHGLVYVSNATSAFISHNNKLRRNPSDHTPSSSRASAEPLPEFTSGSYLVPNGKLTFNCNQCNFPCTQDPHLTNHSFHPSHPSSKCRVPGARDHQWERLRLSHCSARPIETCGLRTAPTKLLVTWEYFFNWHQNWAFMRRADILYI